MVSRASDQGTTAIAATTPSHQPFAPLVLPGNSSLAAPICFSNETRHYLWPVSLPSDKPFSAIARDISSDVTARAIDLGREKTKAVVHLGGQAIKGFAELGWMATKKAANLGWSAVKTGPTSALKIMEVLGLFAGVYMCLREAAIMSDDRLFLENRLQSLQNTLSYWKKLDNMNLRNP